MTAKELREKIREAVEAAFDGQKRRDDGTFRPPLPPEDCDHIASLVYSTIGRSGLCIAEIVEDDAP